MRGVGRSVGEVAIESFLRPLRATGVDLTRIKLPPLLLVLKQIIGSRDVLEFCLRLLVARMEIRMKFARQLLECVLDLLVSRGSGYAERLVRVFHSCRSLQISPRAINLIQPKQQRCDAIGGGGPFRKACIIVGEPIERALHHDEGGCSLNHFPETHRTCKIFWGTQQQADDGCNQDASVRNQCQPHQLPTIDPPNGDHRLQSRANSLATVLFAILKCGTFTGFAQVSPDRSQFGLASLVFFQHMDQVAGNQQRGRRKAGWNRRQPR